MNINAISNRIFLKNYTQSDLTWLLNNAKKLCCSNDFCIIYYEIIKELEKNNEIDFINKFISICQENSRLSIFNLFRLTVDKSFATPHNIEQLTSRGDFNQNPNLYKILMKTVKPFCDETTYVRLIRYYIDALITNYQFFGEIEKVISSIDLEIFSDIDDKRLLTDCIYEVDFWNNDLFKKKVHEFFSKHPDKLIECGNIDYHNFKFISKNVIYNGKPIDELFKSDTILINEFGYKNGWDKSEVAMITLYNYYYSKNQINEINNLIHDCLDASMRDGKLYHKPGFEQFITLILKSNYPISLYLTETEIDIYYDELCKLKTNNVFVVFKEYNFGSGEETISFRKYQKAKKFYDKISEEIKQYNFTPLEAYLYSYIKTRSFKSYKFYRDDEKLDHERAQMSRNPFFIIDNDCIVCAGYTNFILEILKRLNISSSYLTIGKEECKGDEYHARVLVHLIDDFYNIDGVYIGEVTGSRNAINEKYSCFDAIMTKNKKSYEQYQMRENTRYHFLDAMGKLDIDDTYKSDNNSEFFEIIDRPISPTTIVKAIINMIRKTKPHLNQDEIIEEAWPYCRYQGVNLLPISGKMLQKQIQTLEGDGMDLYFDFNLFIENTPVQFNNTVVWGYGYDKRRYDILISDKNKSSEETANILSSNKTIFENEYIEFQYDEDSKTPSITLIIPKNFTVEMLKNIFSNAAQSISEILGYTITQNYNRKNKILWHETNRD